MIARAPASPRPPSLSYKPTSLTSFASSPPSPPPALPRPLTLFFLLFFLLSISKGQREKKKGRNQWRQSSNSTYKHAGIIMGRPRRCHDNTQGGEGGGGVRRHRGRDGRKEEEVE